MHSLNNSKNKSLSFLDRLYPDYEVKLEQEQGVVSNARNNIFTVLDYRLNDVNQLDFETFLLILANNNIYSSVYHLKKLPEDEGSGGILLLNCNDGILVFYVTFNDNSFKFYNLILLGHELNTFCSDNKIWSNFVNLFQQNQYNFKQKNFFKAISSLMPFFLMSNNSKYGWRGLRAKTQYDFGEFIYIFSPYPKNTSKTTGRNMISKLNNNYEEFNYINQINTVQDFQKSLSENILQNNCFLLLK